MSTPTTAGKSWAKELIELYRQGCSDAEVASQMNITIKEYYSQIADNSTFAKLVEFGRTLSLAFWESQARLNLGNKQFNSPLYAFYMKNKHGWADKIDTNSTSEVTTYDLDTLRQKTASQVAKFIKDNTPELTDAQRVLSKVSKDMMEAQDDTIQPI